jgi:diadenosine tetraphosphate (Ap4A) HIT family hydrolase
LHRNASLHWFILLPKTTVLDLVDLEELQCQRLMRQAALIGRFLKDTLGYPRVNVGALGLLVPQLHLHVIGRRQEDPCWPAPVWGNLPPGQTYREEELTTLIAGLRSNLGLDGVRR